MGIGRELGKKLLRKAVEKLVELNAATPAPASHPFAAASPRPVVKPPPTGLGDPGRPVQVFGRRSCPWSGRVLALLESNRIEHSYFDLDGYGGQGVLHELKLETKHDTVPFVFVRGRFIGGYNALDEVHRLGQLEYLILSDAERALHPMHGRIEVAPRPHDGERFPGA